MNVFYQRPRVRMHIYGETYTCNHELYNTCTLFKTEDGFGIAVIQQCFDPVSKCTWWENIDDDIANRIYLSSRYEDFMFENAKLPDENGLYPTFPLRQLMWSLRLPPMKKEKWETRFY